MNSHTERDSHDKAIETLRARAAQRGYALHLIDTGGEKADFLICRWNLSRTLPTIEAVDDFLKRAGATMGGA